jgi:hypothetical protein
MHRIGTVVFLCAAIFPRVVSAQETAAGKDKPVTCSVPSISNTTDGTKAELACEWLNYPAGTQAALDALQLLTTFSKTYDKKEVQVAAPACVTDSRKGKRTPPSPERRVDEGVLGNREAARLGLNILVAGAPDNEDLYCAALGDPNDEGQPLGEGISAFLDLLAKSSTLKAADNQTPAVFKGGLLDQARMLIDVIFLKDGGKRELARINASFVNKKSYVALFQLLKAFPTTCPDAALDAAVTAAKAKSPEDKGATAAAEKTKALCHESYPKNLEILRSAYAASAEDLAGLVAAKTAPAAKP